MDRVRILRCCLTGVQRLPRVVGCLQRPRRLPPRPGRALHTQPSSPPRPPLRARLATTFPSSLTCHAWPARVWSPADVLQPWAGGLPQPSRRHLRAARGHIAAVPPAATPSPAWSACPHDPVGLPATPSASPSARPRDLRMPPSPPRHPLLGRLAAATPSFFRSCVAASPLGSRRPAPPLRWLRIKATGSVPERCACTPPSGHPEGRSLSRVAGSLPRLCLAAAVPQGCLVVATLSAAPRPPWAARYLFPVRLFSAGNSAFSSALPATRYPVVAARRRHPVGPSVSQVDGPPLQELSASPSPS